jgi:hypothetical protein
LTSQAEFLKHVFFFFFFSHVWTFDRSTGAISSSTFFLTASKSELPSRAGCHVTRILTPRSASSSSSLPRISLCLLCYQVPTHMLLQLHPPKPSSCPNSMESSFPTAVTVAFGGGGFPMELSYQRQRFRLLRILPGGGSGSKGHDSGSKICSSAGCTRSKSSVGEITAGLDWLTPPT